MLQSRFLGVFFLVILLFNLFAFNHSISYWEEDEAAYAGFAQTMIETGDWVNPQFDWSRIHRKTPLHFWLSAVSMSIFGQNSFALRLPSVLAFLLSCFLLWRWGGRIWGQRVGGAAAWILASTLILPIYAKVAFTDGLLLLCQLAMVLSLWNFLLEPKAFWRWQFWFWLALGILAKGPPIVILGGGLCLSLLIFHAKRRLIWALQPWFGLPLSLLPFLIWLGLSYQRDGGELVLFLYDWYVLKRVGGSVLGQSAPFGYHFLVMFIAFLPWLPWWGKALWDSLKRLKGPWTENMVFLAAWLFWSWLFFELMSSKLPSYALAAHPAMALITARYALTETSNQGNPWPKWISQTLYLLLWLALPLVLAWVLIHQFGDVSRFWAYALVLEWWVLGLWLAFAFRYQGLLAQGRLLLLNALMAWAMLLVLVLPVVEQSPIKALVRVADAAINAQQALSSKASPSQRTVHLAGIGVKQAKISPLVYLQARRIAHQILNDWTQASELLVLGDRVWILGQEGFEAAQNLDLAQHYHIQTLVWWSTDDQLKPYNYYVLAPKRLNLD